MVHASMRSVGCDANDVVRALLAAAGTIVAYVDWEPERGENEPFDPATARARLDHGVLAETIRTWPGALRSAHPDAGVAAVDGAAPGGTSRIEARERAAWIVADHPLQYGYGEGSPLHKLVQADGKVLLLGAPLDTITLLHFSEHAARIPDKRKRHYKRLMNGVFVDFEELDTCDPVHASLPDDYFGTIAREYLGSGRGRTGKVGGATSYLFDAPGLWRFGVEWLERRLA